MKPDFPKTEKKILKFWKENNIFKKSIQGRKKSPNFVFYEGPPTANGKPGIHHVMARTLKDLVCRYKTIQGYKVNRKAGWDTHGLPVEIEVEKNQIIIRPVKNVRDGWDAAFKIMGEKRDDEPMIDGHISHPWDNEEWQW